VKCSKVNRNLGEDDAEHDHHEQRVEHRPQHAEDGPLVAHLQIA